MSGHIQNIQNLQNQNVTTRKKRKASVDQRGCVACGCCVKCCPREAVRVKSGVHAEVDADKCIGCGLCAKACPASVIEMIETMADFVTSSIANFITERAEEEKGDKADEK